MGPAVWRSSRWGFHPCTRTRGSNPNPSHQSKPPIGGYLMVGGFKGNPKRPNSIFRGSDSQKRHSCACWFDQGENSRVSSSNHEAYKVIALFYKNEVCVFFLFQHEFTMAKQVSATSLGYTTSPASLGCHCFTPDKRGVFTSDGHALRLLLSGGFGSGTHRSAPGAGIERKETERAWVVCFVFFVQEVE